MEKKRRFSIPWHVWVFDAIGAVLVAAGFYQYVSDGSGVIYIVGGLLLMLPLVLHVVNFGKKDRDKR